MLFTPSEPDVVGQSLNLLDADIALPDDTIVRVQMQTYAAGVRDFGACATLARRIFDTLALGPRALDLSAGTRTFEVFGTHYTVDVPADWTVVTQRGPDFTTIYIRELVTMGDTPPRLILTFGASGGDIDSTPGRAVHGTFLGRATDWTEYAAPSGDPSRRVLVARALVTLGRLRVAASAQTFVPALREDMVRIASTVHAAH